MLILMRLWPCCSMVSLMLASYCRPHHLGASDSCLPGDPVICVCGPAHPLGSRVSVPLGMLASTYLALNPWGRDAAEFQAELQRSGVPEWRWRECSDANTAIRLARHHDHVALITESSADDELASGALIRLKLRPMPRWAVPLALAYREVDRNDPAITAI